MDDLTAKLRARDRAEWRNMVDHVRAAAWSFRGNRRRNNLIPRLLSLADLVFYAQALHARRGTLNLPSTQRAIARYVF